MFLFVGIAHMDLLFLSRSWRANHSAYPCTLSQKLSHWFHRLWNTCDAFFIATYLMAQPLRFQPETFRVGRVFICCINMYW